jgi:hypothetical protein
MDEEQKDLKRKQANPRATYILRTFEEALIANLLQGRQLSSSVSTTPSVVTSKVNTVEKVKESKKEESESDSGSEGMGFGLFD